MARMIFLVLFSVVACEVTSEELASVRHEFCVQLTPLAGSSESPVVTSIAVDPRGQWIAAAGDDHGIRILSADDLAEVAVLEMHQDWVRGLDFSADGTMLASTGNDGRIYIWQRDHQWRSLEAMSQSTALSAVRFAPDGKMVAVVGMSPSLTLVNLETDARPQLNCSSRDLRTVAFRGDGLVLAAAGRSGDLHLFDAITGSTVDDVRLHGRRINAITFVGTSNRMVTVGEDGRMVVYDFELGKVIRSIDVAKTKLMTVQMLDGYHAAVGGSDNQIYIYNIETGLLIEVLKGHSGTIATLAAGNRVLYSGGFDTTVRRWRLDVRDQIDRVARQLTTDVERGPIAAAPTN